jgi:SAM-dependent methyltransferase
LLEEKPMIDNPILAAVFQPWRMSVITTACRLRLFSRLDDGSMDVEQLAREAGCVPHLLEALLDACVAMGLLGREDGRYRNTHLSSAHLVEGRPLYVGHILEIQARGASRWGRLLHLVTTGQTQEGPDELGEQHPVFTRAMNDLGMLNEASALASTVDLSGCRSLVDLGCGSGIYSITLCRRFPQLTATLVDREQVLPTTNELVASSGVADRIHVRAGDMETDPIGEGVDAVLLSDSFYYEGATAKRILRSVLGALDTGGTVIIRGYYPDPGASEPLFGAIFRLNLLLFDPQRTPPGLREIKGWLDELGFRNVHAFALTEKSTCVLARK